MLRRIVVLISLIFSLGLEARLLAQTQPGENSTASPAAVPAPEQNPGGPMPTLQHRNARYKLHSADVLELSFPFSPEFNQTVTVQPDGYISLRGVESIRVLGQTIPEMTQAVQGAYSKILHDPVVNVELKDFEKPFFIVGGEVGRPGKFDLRSETTVAEAVAVAGGLKESSKHSEVYLYHRVSDGWIQSRKINLKEELAKADLNEDPYVQPGDLVYVPKNAFSKIARFLPTSAIGVYSTPSILK